MSYIFKNKQEFEIEGLCIPEFQINDGDFIRFWIENVNFENNPKINYFKFIKNFKNHLINELNFTSNEKYKYNKGFLVRFYKLFFNYTLKDYLKKHKIHSSEFSDEIKILNLSLTTKLKNFDSHLLKVLEIFITIYKNNNVVIDYFGLGANAEKILTPYLKQAISKNKTIIALDNLSFKSRESDYCGKIKNIDIKQIKSINVN